MDDFVCNKLTEWGLSEWIGSFKEHGIGKESLYCLTRNEDIDKLIPKMGPKLIFMKRLKLLQVRPSTSAAAKRNLDPEGESSVGQSPTKHQHKAIPGPSPAKRKLDPEGESSEGQSPTKHQHKAIPGPSPEATILFDVKTIMGHVHERLRKQQPTKLNNFLKNKIRELKIDKKELVGVFGKTGAGKSSLINAVLREKHLLPSGSVSACTSVMIKVEANMDNSKYEADIEFITVEEWRNELWSMCQFLWNADQKKHAAADGGDDDDGSDGDDDDFDDVEHRDIEEKLSALYGEEWKQKKTSHEDLMDNKYFREIPEFFFSRKKTLTAQTAKELSAQFIKYTRSDSKQEEGRKEIKRWYWPLVKSVTVKVPNNDLQHVTLVDLPGNGDRNKSRDEMWKECSTVWIVTDINRAASEKEPWEILKGAASFIGNGGQCQYIHFICTKSDCIEEADDNDIYAQILKRNRRAKEAVNAEFNKQKHIKKHFSEDTFEVFTVSSKRFLQRKCLQPEDTEIPKLQRFLKNLNDSHSETVNYVSGAHGILSLIQGASCRDGANKNTAVCAELEHNLNHQICKVKTVMAETYKAFQICLDAGVERSRSSCEKELSSFLYPRKKGGKKRCGFHGTLKCVVKYGGIHKPKKGAAINLNMKLSSHLTDSIDEEFRRTFPQTKEKCGAFKGVINSFSLNTERLIDKYKTHKDVKLQLVFLKTEEDMMKIKLNQMIRECKKLIYSSLTETVEKTMQTSYERAAVFKGKDTLKNMRNTLEQHVHDSKDTMFKQAKNNMLKNLNDLQKFILLALKNTMMESIELSLKTDEHSIPDVSEELVRVEKYYYDLQQMKSSH
ncbi:nuclear GTPase SLIP-GC-like isoform X2 [Parambassis ranga]|uniref:Nuclear GTPase SLIP-GC-like isoform X2 n=1 Tax=Parambassis ranga TaxID=210632 RepID=A0A6P7IVC2_9TELE|nr:nuclear GTPase SLIP-GC-like isoform X2 [Parambassis ranga]